MNRLFKSNLRRLVLASVLLPGLSLASVDSQNIQVKMNEPYKLGDIELSNSSLRQSARQIQNDMVKLLQQLSANYLSDGAKIEMTINRLDLPGYVDWNFGHGSNIRVIRQHDFMKIEFDYEISDASGNTLAKGTDTLKEFYEADGRRGPIKQAGSVEYFRDLLGDWMKEKVAAK